MTPDTKINRTLDKACNVIHSCETQEHVTAAIRYIGLTYHILRGRYGKRAALITDELYGVLDNHKKKSMKHLYVTKFRNKNMIKNYDTLQLAILQKK